jgi:hypothetical protein
MVGGKVIEVTRLRPGEVRIWVTGCREGEWGRDLAVHVAEDPAVGLPDLGEEIWWHSPWVLWGPGDSKRLRKISNSYDPHETEEPHGDR